MTEQPDFLEISTTQYDCGECGHSFLERVFHAEDDADDIEWMVCPNCGWNANPPGGPVLENEWYRDRYSG